MSKKTIENYRHERIEVTPGTRIQLLFGTTAEGEEIASARLLVDEMKRTTWSTYPSTRNVRLPYGNSTEDRDALDALIQALLELRLRLVEGESK